MADNNAFDSASTDLFCNEETKALCFDDDDHLLQPFTHQTHPRKGQKDMIFSNGESDSEPFIHLPCLSEECIGYMLEREREHLPRHDYLSRLRNGDLDIGLRREALDWMFKVWIWLSFLEFLIIWSCSIFICANRLSIYSTPIDIIHPNISHHHFLAIFGDSWVSHHFPIHFPWWDFIISFTLWFFNAHWIWCINE